MDQHASSAIKTVLNEGVGGGKMLQQILVVDVIYLDDQVLIFGKESFIQRETQHREDMGDVCLLESLLAAERKDATASRAGVR